MKETTLMCGKYKLSLKPEKEHIFIYVKAHKGWAYMGATKTKKEALDFIESEDAESLIKAALHKHKRNMETGNNYSIVFYECGYDGHAQRSLESYYMSKYGLHI